jgi:acetylornithine deacetylase
MAIARRILCSVERRGQPWPARAHGEDAPLGTGLLDAVERTTGWRPPLYASTATTDARSLQLYGGTPAVCIGPVAEHAHGVDERVYLPSVVETAQAIALFIGDWCGLG